VKRVFVCSRYRGDVAAHVLAAREACRTVLRAGDAPFAPHLLYPAILRDEDPVERAAGIACGLRWLAAADVVAVFGKPSDGMEREIAEATRLGKEIRLVP
jgi:hypothetical protein